MTVNLYEKSTKIILIPQANIVLILESEDRLATGYPSECGVAMAVSPLF